MALSPRARSSIQLTNRYPRAPPYFRMLRPSSDATVAIMATSAELKDARSRMFDRSLNTATCRSTSARMSNRPSVVRLIVFCGSGRSQLEQCVFGRKGDGIVLPFPSRWRSYAAWHTQPHQTQRSCVDPDQVCCANVRFGPVADVAAPHGVSRLRAMCGRLRVGKGFLHVCSIGRCSHVFGLLARFA